MNSIEKLSKLRELMKRDGIDYFVIPTSDPHMSEYVLERFKSRVYLTNFTGSAGYAIVSQNDALLWADGRYHVQAANEIKDTPFKLMKWGLEGVDTWQEWLDKNVKKGDIVGFNGYITSEGLCEEIKDLLGDRAEFKYEKDLVGEFWEDRPELPKGKAFILDEEFTGESPMKKLEKIREDMKKAGANYMFISTLDDIAYTLNLRGHDDNFTPYVVSYLIIDKHNATLYVNDFKLDQTVKGYLQKNGIKFRDYDVITDDLRHFKENDYVWINSGKISSLHYKILNENTNIIDKALPTTMMKAVKNDVEISNTKKAHIIDGAALTRYLFWMKNNAGKVELNEYTAQEKLHEFRAEAESFISESFGTISAYKGNAAMAHYSANEHKHADITNEGIYLVDSGGQYYEGTTDVTRTITLGNPTEEEIRDYTLTLIGHINLYMAKFLKGTCGCHLDVLARGRMWEEGIDFKHGTGHGVGFVLGVHEGPMSISRALINVPLEPGMVISNEPGIYRENKHGIRIENLITVTEFKSTEFGSFYQFENLTYTPYDKDLIDVSLLNEDQIKYINDYHKACYDKLISGMKTDEEKQMLKEACSPLEV